MKNLKLWSGVLPLIALLLAGCVIICPGPRRETIAFSTIDHSTYSGVQEAKNVVVRDTASWTLLWKAHTGSDIGVPAIDFNTHMVIAVFLGTLPNGCYSTQIVRIYRANAVLNVHRVDTVPGEGAICTLVIVTPAHLVSVPRSAEPVVFSAERRTVP
jgi:hypothetical protein